jgi:serine/threonine protein kinase
MGEANRLIGEVLNDTYRIERLIGEGGMGTVYEASHLRLARRFAVKVLSSAIAKSPEALARFGREAKVTSAIGHPHIVEVTASASAGRARLTSPWWPPSSSRPPPLSTRRIRWA